ncbi:MAG: 50S ribosomal protein L44e [Candidatus Korarchaeota archaeon NZ13-K]|nr:MAG: 50S ribosomal protein L44e [Candidatus Korarchaeota archaeon NZ13-K]
MQVPATIRTYCPRCRRHTPHKVSLYKAGRARTLSWGQRQLERKRRGYGGEPRGMLRRKAKTTKKALLVLTCEECGRKVLRNLGRLAKVEVQR